VNQAHIQGVCLSLPTWAQPDQIDAWTPALPPVWWMGTALMPAKVHPMAWKHLAMASLVRRAATDAWTAWLALCD